MEHPSVEDNLAENSGFFAESGAKCEEKTKSLTEGDQEGGPTSLREQDLYEIGATSR